MTVPGGYSAGTIFLQVVPSFRGFHEEIRRQAKQAQREVDEQARRDAVARPGTGTDAAADRDARTRGEREARAYAGRYRTVVAEQIKKAQREIGALQIRAEDGDAVEAIDAVKAHLATLHDRTINLDLDPRQAYADLAEMIATVKSVRDLSVDVQLKTNLGAFVAELETARAAVQRLGNVDVELRSRNLGAFTSRIRASLIAATKALPEIEFTGDNSDAEHALDVIRADIARLSATDIKPGVDSRKAKEEIDRLIVRLEDLAHNSPDIDIKVNSFKAIAELKEVQREADETERKVKGIGNSGGTAGLRAFSGAAIGIALVLPLIAPLAAVAAAGIVALGTSFIGAAVGGGVFALALSGIIPAVKALNAQNKNAAKDAQTAAKAQRTAAKGVRDAYESQATAVSDAADANVKAARDVQDAQAAQAQAAVDGARSVADAQQQAADGIQQALEQQVSAERTLQSAQRDSLKAVTALADARKQAAQDQADTASRLRDNALDERSGVIDVFQATVSNINTQKDPGATNLEKEQSDIALKRAQIALEKVRAEGADLRAEQAQQQKDGIEGSQKVQDAQQAVNDAVTAEGDARKGVADAAADLDKARIKGAQDVADAEAAAAKSQADAARTLSDAVANQAKTRTQGADSVRDANERVNDALDAQKEALDNITSSANNVADAMSKLGPAGQEFAKFIVSLGPAFVGLRGAAESGILPGLQDFIGTFVKQYGPQFLSFVTTMSKVIGDLFTKAGESLKNPIWTQFFAMLAQYAPIFTQLYGQIGGELLELIANLAVAFAPLAVDMLKGLDGFLKNLDKITTNLKDKDSFKSFMKYVHDAAPAVIAFFASFGSAVLNIGKGLAPFGLALLGIFTAIFNGIAKLPPGVIGAIVFALAGLVLTIQALIGLVSAVAVIGAIGAALEILQGLIVGTGVVAAISLGTIALLIAILAAVVIALVILYVKVGFVRDFINGAFAFLGQVFQVLYGVVKVVIEAIIAYFQLWFTVVSTVGDLIWHVLYYVGDKISDAWHEKIYPALEPIINVFKDVLQPVWNTFLDFVDGFWNQITEKFKDGVVFVVDTVINGGIIDTFNKVAGFFGSKTFDHIQLPQSFHVRSTTAAGGAGDSGTGNALAAGGYVPGWSAHDKADNIHAMLTAKEYVLPVRATANLRKQIGDEGLEMLRRGMVPQQRATARFADGGWVEAGNIVSAHAGGFTFSVAERAKAMFEGFVNALVAAGYHPVSIGGFADRPINNGSGTKKLSNHAYGAAIDIDPFGLGNGFDSGQTSKIGSGFKGNAFMANLAHQFGLGWGGEWKSSRDWMHFEVIGAPSSATYLGIGAGNSVGGNGLFGVFKDAIGNVIDKPVEWAEHQVESLINKIPGADTEVGGMLVGMGKTLLGDALSVLKNLVTTASIMPGSEDGVAGIDNLGPASDIKTLVQQIAARYGWGDGAEWEALQQIVQIESGFNPNAQNKTSTAFGLFQFLNGTWGFDGIAKTSDPRLQTQAGLDYIKSRYGDPIKAWSFHKAHGYYADGGEVAAGPGGAPTLYDTGGWLQPGLTTVLNASGRPEPVFTAGEFDRLVSGGGQGGDSYHWHDERGTGSPDEFAHAILFQQRAAGRGGKYRG